ncbi:MAG: FprA family A-type flavoprotein [Defluviitaleaceae bacterium]|nr:FprA family A-type flavoprotein [Defluviitaleaceae bacterium]
MYCTRKVTDDLLWVGANDRRLSMFEGVYSVPDGVSYNAYLLTDEKTVLFDTVDKAVVDRFMENIEFGLDGRKLDYLVVHHIEPDHSSAIKAIMNAYPEVTLVSNQKSADFIAQFYGYSDASRTIIVKENDTLNTGKHTLRFMMAPMVHWPEVMVTYDETDRILFSADAFGCFGALNGALFADEVDFARDYLDETRRYYTNIVGKYGAQTQALLKKAASVDIRMICPIHGFVWRKNLDEILQPHDLWSRYEPEEQGVMIAYASIYGNTENAAEILACRLRDRGVKTVMFDVSVSPASDIISAAFKWSHLVFASATYNAGIFVTMDGILQELVAHNIRNRTLALMENGTWAPTSGKLMKELFSGCKNMNLVGEVSIKSGVKESTLAEIEALADTIAASF